MQDVDGPRGWSGNPQRYPSVGGGTVRLPGSPQSCDSQLFPTVRKLMHEPQPSAFHSVASGRTASDVMTRS
jgi:hypothetical protein